MTLQARLDAAIVAYRENPTQATPGRFLPSSVDRAAAVPERVMAARLKPTLPAFEAKAKPAPKKKAKATVAETLTPPEHLVKAPLPVTELPAGWRVTAVYEDAQHKRYRGDGDWLVVTRRGDLIQGHRFATEAAARAFAEGVK